MKKCLAFLVLVCLATAQYNETLGQILGRLTVASYCKPYLIESWSCEPCKKYAKMRFVSVFKNSTNDTLGYIGVDDDLDATILVFRGTLPWDIKNWISDINFLKKKYPYCDNGCEVHEGFYEDYEDIMDVVLATAKNYSKIFQKKNFFVTGHSLGGALATHCVAHFMHQGFKVDQFYSLGSPRVGDAKFQEWFNRIWGNRFKARVTHHRDPVPHLPFEDWGFRHLNTQVYYDWLSSKYTVCNDTGEDKACANQFDVAADVTDHLDYFRNDYATEVLRCQ